MISPLSFPVAVALTSIAFVVSVVVAVSLKVAVIFLRSVSVSSAMLINLTSAVILKSKALVVKF